MMATFDDTTFEHERKHPDRIKLWVEHDSSLEVGQLSRVYPQENWWRVLFALDDEIREELEVGQPVSIGMTENKWGSGFLKEVSIVKQGAVRGAEVVERLELSSAGHPSPPAAARPAAATRAAKGQEVYGGPVIRRDVGKVLSITVDGVTTEFA